MASNVDKVYDVAIQGLNQYQLEQIRQFFDTNEWSNEIQITAEGSVKGKSELTTCADYFIPPTDGAQKCPYCFCRSCITNERNRQMWWPRDDQELVAGQQNNTLRKDCYRRFWAMMAHRGVWDIDEYRTKNSKHSLKILHLLLFNGRLCQNVC